jgi:hypothetical protein
MAQAKVIKLTDSKGYMVLVGVDSIIKATSINNSDTFKTEIRSRGAMVETTYVKESVVEIYELINL